MQFNFSKFFILFYFIFINILSAKNIVVVDNDTLLYMSPFGKDTNTGKSLDSPVLTLQKIQYIIKKDFLYNPQNIVVHIDSGIYRSQNIVWDIAKKNYTITLQGNKNKLPIFDGKGMNRSWLKINYFKGANQTNLHIDSIQIQNYVNGIFFRGNKNNWKENISHNKVKNCRFINIGDKYSSAKMGYSAISLTNSRFNSFIGNEFINIINNKTICKKDRKCFSTDTHIHGFYLAYYSSYNIIENNKFKNISGDAIRVRDFCNFNIIENNSFNNIRRVYQDWYAHYHKKENEDHLECYSWGNIIKNSRIGTKYNSTIRASLTNIKTKFYINSGQEQFCRDTMFKEYKLNIDDFNLKEYTERVYLYNNSYIKAM